jgi:hypothetical protein
MTGRWTARRSRPQWRSGALQMTQMGDGTRHHAPDLRRMGIRLAAAPTAPARAYTRARVDPAQLTPSERHATMDAPSTERTRSIGSAASVLAPTVRGVTDANRETPRPGGDPDPTQIERRRSETRRTPRERHRHKQRSSWRGGPKVTRAQVRAMHARERAVGIARNDDAARWLREHDPSSSSSHCGGKRSA